MIFLQNPMLTKVKTMLQLTIENFEKAGRKMDPILTSCLIESTIALNCRLDVRLLN
jgi:hypothetical protein